MTKFIEQHCYARARRGLFRQSEGYDTVARSKGLTESFIKEWLHPYCYYHPSRIMQAKRLPESEFPKALTVVRLPEGLMLIGQTVYVEADFTGQRSAFFTHNYVLEAEEDFCPSTLCKLNFITDWAGEELHQLEKLPLHDGPAETIGPLPFDENRLRQLVEAINLSAVGTKKVYVILPGLDWVFPMLMWLYGHLPQETLRVLGFTTYAREPVNKKFLHLIFMESGSLGDTKLEWDYVFDFDTGYFHIPQVVLEEEQEPESVKINLPKEGVREKMAKIFECFKG